MTDAAALGEVKGRLAMLAPQLAHLSDGRKYRVDVMSFGRWEKFLDVDGTHLCDGAVRMIMTAGFRARGMPG